MQAEVSGSTVLIVYGKGKNVAARLFEFTGSFSKEEQSSDLEGLIKHSRSGVCQIHLSGKSRGVRIRIEGAISSEPSADTEHFRGRVIRQFKDGSVSEDLSMKQVVGDSFLDHEKRRSDFPSRILILPRVVPRFDPPTCPCGPDQNPADCNHSG